VKQEISMLQSIQKLKGFRIIATNERVGTIEDIYFDDAKWVVRYLVVNTGGWLGRRKALVSPYAVQSIDWHNNSIYVNLSRAQVEGSPGIDTAKPVSRQQEAAYHRYYGYPPYWQSTVLWASSAMPVLAPPDTQLREEEEEAHRQADMRLAVADHHLRCSSVVVDYRVVATDDAIGHVADFLLDEATWAIRYLMIDTSHWVHGRYGLISPRWIRAINWAERTLTVALKREEIEQSPEYDPQYAPTREYERAMYRHYLRSQRQERAENGAHPSPK
jgi:sporulation protein YlmC with PRC-barrel domain